MCDGFAWCFRQFYSVIKSYKLILEALNELNLAVVLVFSFGCLIGLLSFERLLSKLFKSYKDLTIAVLTGFLIGSIEKVWPWKIVTIDKG